MKILGVIAFLMVNSIVVKGQGSILVELQGKIGAKIFGSWANEVMQGFYSGSTKLTVFAFDDMTFNSLPPNERSRLQSMTYQQKREYVETYTVVGEPININSFADGQVLTSMNGRKLYINKRSLFYQQVSSSSGRMAVFINGAMVMREQLQASNGVVHILDRPLGLISNKNCYDYLKDPTDSRVQTTALKEMVEKLLRDYFVEAIAPLAMPNPVTFFLPSERALANIPNSKLQSLNPLKLSEYFRQHIIPGRVVFTSYVQRQDNYESALPGSRIVFLRQGERVFVKSGGVVAEVIQGNITVQNGVIHVVDTMLGYVYNSFREQLRLDAPQFNNLLERADQRIVSEMTQNSGMNVFVPMDEAFSYIQNLPWIDINSNRTLINRIVQLCSIRDGSIEVSMLNGNYDVRQRRMTRYNNMKMTIYLDRNDTWVNAGHVRARIIRPDVQVTNGQLQYIDGLPGVPSMDIPTLIYYDDWLVYTYNDLRMLGLDDYLKDPRYDPSMLPPRSFDSNGDASNNYQVGNNFQFTNDPWSNQYTTQYPGQFPNNNQYPNNNNNQYPNNNQNQYPNQYPNNQNQYPNQYPNNYPSNQYPSNQNPYPGNSQYPGGPIQKQISPYGTCGSYNLPCQFTFFVPNGTAIYNFHLKNRGNRLVSDSPRYRYVMRRLIIPNALIFLEQMIPQPQSYQYRAHTGEIVTIKKETDNIARIYWGGQSARIILWDLGATNGVVHIIDTVLSDYTDINRDVSRASGLLSQNFGFMFTVASLLAFYLVRR